MPRLEREPGAPPQAPSNDHLEITQRELRRTTGVRSGTVVVACKIPNGVILQLCVDEKTTEPVMGGGHRDVKVFRKTGESHTVAGPSIPFGTVPRFVMAGGYRLTFGIPAEFWEKWLSQNSDNEIVRRGLIFAYGSMDDVEARCLDNERVLSGLEPIDPKNLPRGIQTAPEQGNRPAASAL